MSACCGECGTKLQPNTEHDCIESLLAAHLKMEIRFETLGLALRKIVEKQALSIYDRLPFYVKYPTDKDKYVRTTMEEILGEAGLDVGGEAVAFIMGGE